MKHRYVLFVWVLAWLDFSDRWNKAPALQAGSRIWLCLFRGLARFPIRVEAWEVRCVKELWRVHQIVTEQSLPHSSSRGWEAAADVVVIISPYTEILAAVVEKTVSGEVKERLQTLLTSSERIVLSSQVWRNSRERRKVREDRTG